MLFYNIFRYWAIFFITIGWLDNPAIAINLSQQLHTLQSSLEKLQINFSLTHKSLTDLQHHLSSQKDKQFELFNQLVTDMKYYKTTNSDHSGHLYEHSMWVARVIDGWFESNEEWVQGIDKKHRPMLVLAGFLHDIGKASNPSFPYNFTFQSYFNTTTPLLTAYPSYRVIPSHPRDGFDYFIKKQTYKLSLVEDNPQKSNKKITQKSFRSGASIDLDAMLADNGFKKYGWDKLTFKLIAVLVGMHYDFGASVIAPYSDSKNNDSAYRTFLQHLQQLVAEIGSLAVDGQLLRMAILIGAADVRGIQPFINEKSFDLFIQRYHFFSQNTTLFTRPQAHGNSAHTCYQGMFERWSYPQKGLSARRGLINYFENKKSI